MSEDVNDDWPDDGLPESDELASVFDELGAPRPGDAARIEQLVDEAIGASAGAGLGAGAWVAAGGGTIVALGIAWALGAFSPNSSTHVPEVEAVAPAEATVETLEEPAHPEPVTEAAPDPPPVVVAAETPADSDPNLLPPSAETAPSEESASVEAAPDAPTAAQLLAAANEARRADQPRRALKTYATLRRLHPESREAQLALVARGRLQLDVLDDPKAAARDFDRYLQKHPRGGLVREAAVGRARAWRAAGDGPSERAAWAFVLEHFPDSVHAKTAAARLAALED